MASSDAPPHAEPPTPDPGIVLDRAARAAIGRASQGVGDLGRVLATLDTVVAGEPGSWRTAWEATGAELRGHAVAAAAAGSTRSARWFYLAASDAWATSRALGDDVDAGRDATAQRRARECWERVVDLSDGRHLPHRTTYDGVAVDGHLLRPDRHVVRRPTLVMVPEEPVSPTSQWALGGARALERGWNVFVASRVEPRQLAAVLGSLSGSSAIATTDWLAYGVGRGAWDLAHDLVDEHRLTAAVLDPGASAPGEALLDRAADIRTSLLVVVGAAECEAVERLVERLPASTATARLGEVAGAAGHLAPWSRGLVEHRALDFLENRVRRAATRVRPRPLRPAPPLAPGPPARAGS